MKYLSLLFIPGLVAAQQLNSNFVITLFNNTACSNAGNPDGDSAIYSYGNTGPNGGCNAMTLVSNLIEAVMLYPDAGSNCTEAQVEFYGTDSCDGGASQPSLTWPMNECIAFAPDAASRTARFQCIDSD